MTYIKTLKSLIISLVITSSFFIQTYASDGTQNILLSQNSKTDYNYIGVKGGVVISSPTEGNSDLQSVSANTTYNAGIFVGRKFMDRYAFEIVFDQRGKSDINSSNLAGDINTTNSWGVSAKTVMFNISADLLTHDLIRPYVKLGAGFSRNKTDNYTYYSNNTTTTWKGKTIREAAWNAGFGLNFSTYQSIDSFIEYSFINRGKFKTYGGATLNVDGVNYFESSALARFGFLREQVINVGVKFKF